MRLEYLIPNNLDISELESAAKTKGAVIRCEEWKDDPQKRINLSIVINSESEESAIALEKLSRLLPGDKVVKLVDGPSSYYANRLYPLFNNFETALRRLLTLTAQVNTSVKEVASLEQLETWSLEKLFSFLFESEDFVKDVRKVVNDKGENGRRGFEKQSIIERISNIEEHTVWMDLFGVDTMPTMLKSHNAIRNYRNDVMHMHNLSRKGYNSAKRLVEKATTEIDYRARFLMRDKEALRQIAEKMAEALINYQKMMEPVAKMADLYTKMFTESTTPLLNAVNSAMTSTIVKAYKNSGTYGSDDASQITIPFKGHEAPESIDDDTEVGDEDGGAEGEPKS